MSSASVPNAAGGSGKLSARTFAAVKALELMGVFAGWDWTYDRLIRQIWPLMSRAPPSLFGAIVRLMGRLAQQGVAASGAGGGGGVDGGAEHDALHDLRQKFAHILDPSSANRCTRFLFLISLHLRVRARARVCVCVYVYVGACRAYVSGSAYATCIAYL